MYQQGDICHYSPFNPDYSLKPKKFNPENPLNEAAPGEGLPGICCR